MPGLKRSPGMADFDVCDGAHMTGYNALGKAMRKSHWTRRDPPSVSSRSSLSHTVYPDLAPPIPTTWPESPSDDGKSSDYLVHEGFENLAMPPPLLKAPAQAQGHARNLDETGLPPTPPTLNTSDVAGSQHDHQSTSSHAFADGVRNALESKAPGQSVTPVNAGSPPTPDPSPPATVEPPPVMEQKEKPQFLHPMIAESRSAHGLTHYPSSKAESFRTAHEDQPLSPVASTSQVHLPEEDTLPTHWLDNSRELEMADMGLKDVAVQETPKVVDDALPSTIVSEKNSRRKSKHESPPQTAEGDGTDWEKHISYVVDPEELDDYVAPEEETKQTEVKKLAQGLGLSGAGLNQDIERSAEDVNNMVYKRIREENVIRHSAVSANSGAITVGIIVPPSESTPRTLKRQTKCVSLRDDIGSESNRGSMDGDFSRSLSHKKIRLPERQKRLDESPVFESSIRQVSSPARLGPDASNMTALTFASLQDSPSARQNAKFTPERKHTLRHFSHGDRLSNNPSVRRNSLQGSPPSPNTWLEGLHDAEPPVVSPPRTPPQQATNADNIGHNVGVKRNSTDGAKPSRVLQKAPNPVRGVIPSIATEPEEWSPTTGKLRRFSREERLENNEQVRRTSLGSSRDAVKPSEDVLSPSAVERSAMFPTEKPVLPSSPRKSLDARFLHPTTTPMSVSQFSDRSADVEVCEASGVRLYPHNNDSLLVVQNGSRPASKDKDLHELTNDAVENHLKGLGPPLFSAQVDPPTPTLRSAETAYPNVDSPLTNPRTAPEPPVIKFIPPTPNKELEALNAEGGALGIDTNLPPQRRLSLLQKARRYSDSLFVRAGSLRRPRTDAQPEQRDVHLSPLWRPQGFWDDFDSEDEEYFDDFEPVGSLPKGGDTSDVPDTERSRTVFPRAMSKRLPGFRGKGGFLVGNSLGIERHGTNTRRHYVSTSERTLGKRESAEVLQQLPHGARVSRESFGKGGKRVFVVPFSGGKRAQWVGAARLRARMAASRAAKEEREAEKRRERLRARIGMRVYHDTGTTTTTTGTGTRTAATA